MELERTNRLLAEILGSPPRLYRAPHYDVDERVDAIAARLGLRHTRGDVTPPDWHDRWTAGLSVAFVLQQLRSDTIIGLHDGIPPTETRVGLERQLTVDAVAAILPRLKERGLRCVRASEILGEEDEP